MKIALRYRLVVVSCGMAALTMSCDKLQNLPFLKKAEAPKTAQNSGPAAEEAKQRALEEVLAEMMRVVLRREPKDSVEFTSWLEALYQGASTEGIYRGFTHSSDYRKVEVESPLSKPECVIRFVREMRRLQSAMKTPTAFREKDAETLSEVVNPEESSGEAGAKGGMLPALKFGKEVAKPVAPVAAAPAPATTDLAKLFAKAKFYTLKRVLGDEALKLLQEKDSASAKAEWYGTWAAEMGKLGIDFGIPLRNRSDATFHHEWALSTSEDRLTWEVLNRLHRVLNGCL